MTWLMEGGAMDWVVGEMWFYLSTLRFSDGIMVASRQSYNWILVLA